MRYSRRNNLATPGAGILAGGIGVFILLLLILRFVFPGALPALFAPLLSFGAAISGGGTNADEKLIEENAELRNENEALKARLQDVGAAEDIPTDAGILVGVSARPPLSPYDTLLLTKGTEAGIRENAIVFALGVPVGTIAESGNGYARAVLFSSRGRTVEGWVGETRQPITMTGAGGGAFTAAVPRDLPITEGETVYLPGPGAFPAGTVRSIERHAASPSAELHIEPLVNLFTLTFVRVLP